MAKKQKRAVAEKREHPRSDRVRIAVIAIFGGVCAFGVFSGIGKSGTSDPYGAILEASFIAATLGE